MSAVVLGLCLVFLVLSCARDNTAALRAGAEQGDAAAQFKLGVMYRLGQGVAQDDKQAAAWFRKAAEQGLAVAQVNLGLLYGRAGRGNSPRL